jgi:hypothetical protein
VLISTLRLGGKRFRRLRRFRRFRRLRRLRRLALYWNKNEVFPELL